MGDDPSSLLRRDVEAKAGKEAKTKMLFRERAKTGGFLDSFVHRVYATINSLEEFTATRPNQSTRESCTSIVMGRLTPHSRKTATS
jgi:hypothetical protein